jgi:acetyl esterase/lipase
MRMIGRVDPELVPSLEEFLSLTGGGVQLHDISADRRMMAQLMSTMSKELPAIEGITTEDRRVLGPGDAPPVAVRIYQPTDRPEDLPALFWIHGGGYVFGSFEMEDLAAKQLAEGVQCVVVSVDYRLAPENPFPAPVEDCYAALRWLSIHSDELGVRKSRIAIGGASAGGGLAASLALLARDRKEVEVAFQLLIYPMIDDRNITPASDAIPDTLVWSRENNLIGWKSYLGHEPGVEGVSPYAAACRATDLSGLPPAYIAVGGLDLFLNENIEYARRLLKAGVPTELHVYPGAFHGFDSLAPKADISQRFKVERDTMLKRVLHR